MKSFATYIEYILMTQHYVFVPSIGGFMLKEIAGQIAPSSMNRHAAKSFKLIPPHRELQFNRFMSHDDGMLINTYMEVDGLTYDEADACIKHEVNVLKTELERRGKVQLGALGQLIYDQNCHISFVASALYPSDPNHFGLETCEVSALSAPTSPVQADKTHHSDTIIIPIRKQWLQRVAIIAIIIGCFFANFSPSGTYNKESNFASMLDSELLTGSRKPHIQADHSWEEIWDEETARMESADSVAALAAANAELAVSGDSATTPHSDLWIETKTIDNATAENAHLEQSTNGKIYYIIVASCASQEEADRNLKRLEKNGYSQIGVLKRDGRYRLYINVFPIKNAAEIYLGELRDNEAFHDAWLLPVRMNSISHISKNKHNEQLPMELSHLTKRTDRDQGSHIG